MLDTKKELREAQRAFRAIVQAVRQSPSAIDAAERRFSDAPGAIAAALGQRLALLPPPLHVIEGVAAELGIDEGLEVLKAVRSELGVPVVTDIHTPDQAERAGAVVDVLQIPAFEVAPTPTAEEMDTFRAVKDPMRDWYVEQFGQEWYDKIQGGEGMEVAMEIIDSFSRGTFPDKLMYWPDSAMYRSAWDKTIAAAEKYNEPGRFTAFIGYEWTSQVPPGQNLHRVVIYKDGSDKASQTVPATTYPPQGSTDPEYLWNLLGTYEEKTGGQVLAIPHNGNLSNGIMFPIIDTFTGKSFDRAYAETRAKWEPLYEATQIKGDGEAHPFLSPDDEFADYETWDRSNLNGPEAKTPDMLQYEYAREALKNGLLPVVIDEEPHRWLLENPGAEVEVDAADGHVHGGEAPGGGVGFLAVDREVAELAAVFLDKALALDEEAAGAHGGVVDAALVGLEHLDDQGDDGLRSEVLAALLALGEGELAEEVFVDLAEDVARDLGFEVFDADAAFVRQATVDPPDVVLPLLHGKQGEDGSLRSVLEIMGLPYVVLRTATYLVLLGFPIAVVLAWAYERTAAGVKRTDPAATGELDAIVAQPASKRWPNTPLLLPSPASPLVEFLIDQIARTQPVWARGSPVRIPCLSR